MFYKLSGKLIILTSGLYKMIRKSKIKSHLLIASCFSQPSTNPYLKKSLMNLYINIFNLTLAFYCWLEAFSSACSKSLIRSLGSSIPIDSLNKFSLTGKFSPDTVFLCSIKLSTPPNDVAG